MKDKKISSDYSRNTNIFERNENTNTLGYISGKQIDRMIAKISCEDSIYPFDNTSKRKSYIFIKFSLFAFLKVTYTISNKPFQLQIHSIIYTFTLQLNK